MDKLSLKIDQINKLMGDNKFIQAYSQFYKFVQSVEKFIQNMDNEYFEQKILNNIRDWGLIFKNNGKFQYSKLLYRKGIYLINLKKSKNISIEDKKSLITFNYTFYSNLSLIYIDQAEQTNKKGVKIQQLNRIIQLLDESYKYLKQSQKILLPMIMNKKTSQNTRIYCLSQYMNYICNLCENFIIYALNQNYHDYILKSIIKMVDQVERYSKYLENQLQKKQYKQSVQPILHQCFYWKACSFKFLGQDQESLKYFIKDYNYCKKRNDKQNLQKTCQGLLQILLKRFQFNQASNYTNNNGNLKQQVQKNKRKYNETFIKFQKQTNQQKIKEQFIQFYEIKQYRSVLRLCQIIKKNKIYKQDAYVRYLTTFFHSWALYKHYHIDQSLKQIQIAFQMQKDDPLQFTQCLMLKVLIYEKKQHDKEKVQKMYKQIIYKIQQKKFDQKDNLINEINQNLNNYRKYCQIKDKFVKRVESDQFKQMEKFVNKELEYIEGCQQEQEGQRIQEEEYIEQKYIIRNDRTEIRSYQMTAGNKYEQQCKLLSIQPNEVIKQLLINNHTINFNDFFMFPSQQILAIIRSIQYFPEMDLRNIIITADFIQKIREQNSVNQVKKLKINLINGQYQKIQNFSIKITKKSSNSQQISKIYQQFNRLLHRLSYLQHLSILCFYHTQYLTNTIFNTKIKSFSSITCLKLKQCNLYDQHLQLLKLGQNFPQIKQLSLSHNCIEGKMLGVLNKLTQLEKVNLSNNPINEMGLRQKMKMLKYVKLRNIKQNNNSYGIITQKQYQNYYYLLNNCIQIDFSQSSFVFIRILQKFTSQLYEDQLKQQYLTKLILKDCVIHYKDLQILLKLHQQCPKLKQIDMRGVKILNNVDSDENKININMNRQYNPNKMEIQQDINMMEIQRGNNNKRVGLTDQNIIKKVNQFKVNLQIAYKQKNNRYSYQNNPQQNTFKLNLKNISIIKNSQNTAQIDIFNNSNKKYLKNKFSVY